VLVCLAAAAADARRVQGTSRNDRIECSATPATTSFSAAAATAPWSTIDRVSGCETVDSG
jgi:hypothetical protein